MYCFDLPKEPSEEFITSREYVSKLGTNSRLEYFSADVRDQALLLKKVEEIGDKEQRIDIREIQSWPQLQLQSQSQSQLQSHVTSKLRHVYYPMSKVWLEHEYSVQNVEVACAPGTLCQWSAHKYAVPSIMCSVDLVIVLFSVGNTCHRSCDLVTCHTLCCI